MLRFIIILLKQCGNRSGFDCRIILTRCLIFRLIVYRIKISKELSTQIRVRRVSSVILHRGPFVLHQGKLARIHHFVFLGDFLPSHISRVVNMESHLIAIRIGIFGSDDNYTVCTLRTVNSSSRSILQYVHRSNVTRRNIRNRTNRHTIHDIKRVIALRQRSTTTNADLHIGIRTTFCSGNRHTGQLTLQSLCCARHRNILQLVSAYRSYRCNHVTFLGSTVTGNYYLFQYFCIFLQHYIHYIAGDVQLLGCHTDVREHKHFCIIWYFKGVITVEIRHCTNSGTFHEHRG